ncbi:uncharacterized protein LOC129762706 [Toxorhynchites rutilus septentrionalis]|uniref:uncharacterized protein LOC129762706 n=1 Tax=Toxorhynchites rutilus septentrionalis TaxID=329112 RepID=UPI002478BC39|nr:uncharacterized protein LOC129762706 [Toxorhynchites rutilus septentrionalis]
MLLLALRSMFFLAVLVGYSSGIWRLINDYFHREFKSFLEEEVKKNKYLLEDPTAPETNSDQLPVVNNVPADNALKQSSAPVSSNRLLDEVIVGFGRLFTSQYDKQRGTSTKQGQDKTLISSIPPPVIGAASGSSSTAHDDYSDRNGQREAIVIECDELSGRGPSPPSNDDDWVAEEEEEEVRMGYWKNRNREVEQGENMGYCVGDQSEEELLIDSCGYKFTP